MLSVKLYRQKPELCGPSSLKMVLEYYGIQKSEEELANLAGYIPSEGVNVLGLINAAKSLGLSAFYKDFSEIDDLKEWVINKKVPVIIDWFSTDDGHYSVVVDLDDKNIYIQDPELADLRIIPIEKFKRIWFDFAGDYIKSKDDIIIRRIIVIHK